MFQWLYLMLLLPAAALVIEDFRLRQISVAWLGILGIMTFVLQGAYEGWPSALAQVSINMVLLTLLTGSLILWLLLRQKHPRQLFQKWIGVGDLVFMAVVTPLFGPEAYVRFLLAACLAALVWWAIKRPQTIPLAGIMALTLVGYTICKSTGVWS